MSTLYLTQHGTEITKDGGRLVLKCKDEIKYLPSSYAEIIVVLANASISYSVIKEILRCGGSIIYLDKDGSLLGEMGRSGIGVRNRIRQMRAYLDDGLRLEIAKAIVQKKIIAQKDLLRVKNKGIDNDKMQKAIVKLGALVGVARKSNDIEKLMGIEGIASKTYFDMFNVLLEDTEFQWIGRRRPAKDPVNAMMNFGYSLLEKDIRRFINVSGLDSYVGFLHSTDVRKESLIYDIMEVFRSSIIDKLIIRCLCWNMFKSADFEMVEGKCYFNDESRIRFIAEYEKYVGSLDDIEGTLREKMVSEVNGMVRLLQNRVNDTI